MTDNPRRIKGMSYWQLKELAEMVTYGGDYNAEYADRHYKATEPLEPERCRCDPPGALSEGRCWKCGKAPARPGR